jgi:steroid 5-alpha reductase family enzyme
MLSAFLIVLAGMSAVMGGAWWFQRQVGNAGWVDVIWTVGTGAAAVLAALWPGIDTSANRQYLVATLAAIWSLRLGLYVGLRVAGGEEDTRYARLRKDWGAKFQSRMFALVIVQAPATALLTVSVYVAAHHPGALALRDWLGAVLLAVAIAGETLADEQMRRFKRSARKGAIIDAGLWAWSRHPNYFFEWLGWLAYPMIGFDSADPLSYMSWLAPALMYLILRWGTGVPALEATMLATRGDAFRLYQQRVSAFFPLPPRGSP